MLIVVIQFKKLIWAKQMRERVSLRRSQASTATEFQHEPVGDASVAKLAAQRHKLSIWLWKFVTRLPTPPVTFGGDLNSMKFFARCNKMSIEKNNSTNSRLLRTLRLYTHT